MDPGKLFHIITNSTLLATRLLSGGSTQSLKFPQKLYCSSLAEDAPNRSLVAKVEAVHETGSRIRYVITKGNNEKHFSINGQTGEVTLVSSLDHEAQSQYSLVIAAEADGEYAVTALRVEVIDVNDHRPEFVNFPSSIIVIEEDDRDLPKVLAKIEVRDADQSDQEALLFTVEGDGVDGGDPEEGTFLIHPSSGELLQIRPLDRDLPNGKPIWNLKIRVSDGQQMAKSKLNDFDKFKNVIQKFEENSVFQRNILLAMQQQVTASNVTRSRRGTSLSTNLPILSSRLPNNAEESKIKGPFSSPEEGRPSKYFDIASIAGTLSYKKPPGRIKRGRFSTLDKRSRSTQRPKKDHLNRHPNRSPRDPKPTRPNRSPIRRMRGPSADTFRDGPKRGAKIDAESDCKNCFENDAANDRRTVNASEASSWDTDTKRPEKVARKPRHETTTPLVGRFVDRSYWLNGNAVNLSISMRDKERFTRCHLICHPKRPLKSRLNSTNCRMRDKWSFFKLQTLPFHRHSLYSCLFLPNKEPFTANDKHLSRPAKLKQNLANASKRLNYSKYPPPIRTPIRNNGAIEEISNKFEKVFPKKLISRNDVNRKDAIRLDGREGSPLSPDLRISEITDRTANKPTKFKPNKRHDRIIERVADISVAPNGSKVTQKEILKSLTKRSATFINDLTCPPPKVPPESFKNRQIKNKVHILEGDLTVFVKDINDNLPNFSQNIFHAEVKENGPADQVVVKATAFDADDITFGTNALLTYSLEKNVVEEHTGERLFKIDPTSGEIRTALCCLDREVTSEYRLQVVATDGGGLQGTATVVVKLKDENDNPPKLVKKKWSKTVYEDSGTGNPSNRTILEVHVTDPDTANHFAYRIVHSSGPGWHLFNVASEGQVGRIFASQTLDYEDEEHRKGFRFKIQVSDEGVKNWSDPRHTDTAWISIALLDVNDHSPTFQQNERRISQREDAKIGDKILTVEATDGDSGKNGEIIYEIEDPFQAFRIEPDGGILIENELDREGEIGPTGLIRVTARDRGVPSRSGHLDIYVTLLDVNDCTPRLITSRVLHIKENEGPKMIGNLLFADDDEESLGHGGPYQIAIAPSTPKNVLQNVSVKFLQDLDQKRGGAEVWTMTSLDREKQSELVLDVDVRDVKGLSTVHKIKIIVDDVNDNKMNPGTKLIYVWRPKALVADFRLGRVFVNDLDDWDSNDKSFYWLGDPHPRFLLNEETGVLQADNKVQKGRYDLHFTVTDHFWQQSNVAANVSVIIEDLSSASFINSVPIVVSSISPENLISNWSQKGKAILGTFIDILEDSLSDYVSSITLVSVEKSPSHEREEEEEDKLLKKISCSRRSSKQLEYERFFQPSSKVWLAALFDGAYVDPVKFRGLLEMEMQQVKKRTSLTIGFEEREAKGASGVPCFASFAQFPLYKVSPIYETSFLSNNFEMQVVDINSTAVVTPFLSTRSSCPSKNSQILFSNVSINSLLSSSGSPSSFLSSPSSFLSSSSTSLSSPSSYSDLQGPSFCTANYCLNGGRCLPTETASRCICPGGTVGSRCKVLSRTFKEGGWAWLRHIPSRLPFRISLRFLTQTENGLLLYQGPLSEMEGPLSGPPTPMLALQIERGRPVLMLEGMGKPILLSINRNASVADGKWHTIHIRIDRKSASLMLDLCSGSSPRSDAWNSSQCLAAATSFSPKLTSSSTTSVTPTWSSESPLQVGGFARPLASGEQIHGWTHLPIRESFQGCIAELKIGGKLRDLGEPAYSSNSQSYCRSEGHEMCDSIFTSNEHHTSATEPSNEENCPNKNCSSDSNKCSVNELVCYEQNISPTSSHCSCNIAGSSSHSCLTYKRPVTLGTHSYSNIALSFVPDPLKVTVRLQFKTKSRDGLLVKLSSQKAPLALSLHISDGYLCLSFSTHTSSRFPQVQPPDNDHENPFPTNAQLGNASAIHNSGADAEMVVSVEEDDGDSSPHSTSLCLTKRPVSDGVWHTAFAARVGHNFIIQIDDAEDWQYNETLPMLHQEDFEGGEAPLEFWVDVREGISVGGVPEFIKRNVSLIYHDLFDACINDLRISGHQLPLPPHVNNTHYGQVTTMQEMKKGCHFDSKVNCTMTHCPPPLVCREVLGQAVCGCKFGSVFTPSGCREMDLCLFEPCLHGGKCTKFNHGFTCFCPQGFTGKYCEWNSHPSHKPNLNMLLMMAVTFSVLCLILTVIIVSIHVNRKSKLVKKDGNSTKGSNTSISSFKRVNDMTGSPTMKIKTLKEMGDQFPQDDLRNYAYEGEGSSSESLGSAITGLQNEIGDPFENTHVASSLFEVIDLLKGLPDAKMSKIQKLGHSSKTISLIHTSPLHSPVTSSLQHPKQSPQLSTLLRKSKSSTTSALKCEPPDKLITSAVNSSLTSREIPSHPDPGSSLAF